MFVEHCGGVDVVREALITLYSGEIVALDTSTQFLTYLPTIMEQALARGSCPFETYEESLPAFVRALYTLQLVLSLTAEGALLDSDRLTATKSSVTIPTTQPRNGGRFGVFITRIDSQEAGDPVGAYTLKVCSAAKPCP